MRNKSGQTRGFRPRGKTKGWIELLENLNVNISDFVNDVLEKHIEAHASALVKKRKAELSRLPDAPAQ